MKEKLKCKSYSISPKGIEGSVKSPVIYGHFEKGNSLFLSPIVYFRKPKWLSDEDFEVIVNSVVLEGLNPNMFKDYNQE